MARVQPVSNVDIVPPSLGKDDKDIANVKVDRQPMCYVVDSGNAHTGKLPLVMVRGKNKQLCSKSLLIFSIEGCFRKKVLSLVEWKWFENFILFLILLNSLALASYQHRADENEGYNYFVDWILDPILTAFFTVEFLLKIVAWGFFLDKGSYLRDAWNWLDFIVVVTALISYIPGMSSNLLFLRLFRILRPLRSLNAVPQMKALVSTVISSVPRLANVTIMMFFCFWIFGIIGITLLDGIFYRGCRVSAQPTPSVAENGALCWSWNYTNDDRLCGGRYDCKSPSSADVDIGFCGGHEEDPDSSVRPVFDGGRRGYPWCDGSAPKKIFPETDFIHFDHIGGALLTIFQCMTMEGWTDVMYYVQDGFGFWIATIYFFLLVAITSFALLNLALAVVDEAREDFETEDPDEDDHSDSDMEWVEGPDADEIRPWWNCVVVRILRCIAFNEIFVNLIMLAIAGNVVTMMLEKFPPEVSWADFLAVCETLFLVIFCVEMVIMLGALGPKGYICNPVTCFDGFIVIISVVQATVGGSGGSAFTALRTLRLFRVLNKLANRWPAFRILLKAMVSTAVSLNYWLVLFFLLIFILALMFMSFFKRQLHFADMDGYSEVAASQGKPWCAGSEHETDVAFRQDCIPRAHFDTFLWSVVTVFQIMTGENWNWIMYSGMRANNWAYALIFILVIVFGQTLILSLFLSMLMSTFDKVQERLKEKNAKLLQRKETQLLKKPGSSSGEVKSNSTGSAEDQNSPFLKGDSANEAKTDESRPAEDNRLSAVLANQDASLADSVQVRRSWPLKTTRAWFILHETNPLRRFCWWLLKKKVQDTNVFDNLILLCILLSTLCMALDYPLRDPGEVTTKIIRTADTIFAIIFIIEMVIKLVAMGLICHEGAYLRSGWNWLDGIVVCVSVMGLVSGPGGGGFLKTLRILRALRPLRVISRNPNLKVVVQTIFASMPALMTLVIVCAVFLLIFALFGLSYLAGTFFACDMGDAVIYMSRHLKDTVSTPMCLSPADNGIMSGVPRGHYDVEQSKWIDPQLGCPFGTSDNTSGLILSWERATSDMPICVGRCIDGQTPTDLCPRKYDKQSELPSNCLPSMKRSNSTEMAEDELIGERYIDSMKRALIMPCAGSVVTSDDKVALPGAAISCRQVFCPDGVSSDKARSCSENCKKHPFYCKKTCSGPEDGDAKCMACRKECEAACECEDHCEALIEDAALCVEQGGKWALSIPQNFDNIWMSLLVLFEISSTEAWVDVMYAACDSTEVYFEPVRDNRQWLFAPFFVLYIFMSFMFLLNLSVGVIVDNFMELKESLKEEGKEVMLTLNQEKWLAGVKALGRRSVVFKLTNLHLLEPRRRQMFNIVTSAWFDAALTGAIVVNTVVMASKIFPKPTEWWEEALQGLDVLFTFIYLVEFLLKMYALRGYYWSDGWNRFDFICLTAAIVGIVLSVAAPDFELGQTFTQIFRIFRVARLFRLLRSKRLNKIFMALVLSLPKLGNVMGILILLLTLYSILGVSLFSAAHPNEFLNYHGNFQHFGWAFITLFRAVTGEAWNSIMHDLLLTERDWFRMDDWCTPDYLFYAGNQESFDILNSKCLIDRPNGCVQMIGGVNWLPAFYWVSYILLIVLMVMNLVIAVILEGYEDGQMRPEDEVIDLCIHTWRKYDSDHIMILKLPEAMSFINEVVVTWFGENLEAKKIANAFTKDTMAFPFSLELDLSRIPMRCMQAFQMKITPDCKVDFFEASRQALRFCLSRQDSLALNEIRDANKALNPQEAKKLQRLEDKGKKLLSLQQQDMSDLRQAVAVVKLQRFYRKVMVPKSKTRRVEEAH